VLVFREHVYRRRISQCILYKGLADGYAYSLHPPMLSVVFYIESKFIRLFIKNGSYV